MLSKTQYYFAKAFSYVAHYTKTTKDTNHTP